MTPDGELLRRYAEQGDETAFAEVVRRQFGLVYGVASRLSGGDAYRAEEVAQLVFTDLARKARSLASRPVLASWLHTSTRYAVAKLRRAEARRWKHEQEAGAMKALLREGEPAAQWERLRPVIDDAVQDLSERDREAVLQRFFANRGFAEIGAALGVSEDAARMRVDRALEKLRDLLARRGLTSTGAALGALLAEQAMAAAPSAVVTSVTSAALAGAGTATAGAATVGLMASMKLQFGATAALLVAGTAGVVWQTQATADLHAEMAALRVSLATAPELRAEHERLRQRAAEVAQLRRDDAEFAQLREAIDAVKHRQIQGTKAEADARAAREAEIRALPVIAERDLDQKPKANRQIMAEIPPEVRRLRVRAESVISFVIDADGKTRDIQVVSSENQAWTDSAVAAVKQWRYEPGKKDGRVVNTRIEVPMVVTHAEVGNPKIYKPGDVRWPWF